MIAVLDERHVARGFDPYNSADQPHVMAAMNAKHEQLRRAFDALHSPAGLQFLADTFSRALRAIRRRRI